MQRGHDKQMGEIRRLATEEHSKVMKEREKHWADLSTTQQQKMEAQLQILPKQIEKGIGKQ